MRINEWGSCYFKGATVKVKSIPGVPPDSDMIGKKAVIEGEDPTFEEGWEIKMCDDSGHFFVEEDDIVLISEGRV
jgi:hypothetical protein